MKHLSSWVAVFVTPLFVSFITIAVLMIGASEARAYEEYSECEDCHGGFTDNPYVSLSDGSDWGDSLHNVHRNDMLDGDCSACHGSDFSSVSIDSSAGGDGLSPISCVGCHGRDEDMGNDGISAGRGAGLRQHHTVAGEESCTLCHSDASPSAYTPVGEEILPNYYAMPGSGHPNMPKESCNSDGTENFAGTALGLDNDGNGVYDTSDSNCTAAATYTVGGSVSGLSGSGLALQNNGADTLSIAASGSFTFATALADSSAYMVTVSSQPAGQTCSVTNGSGTISAANVTNVAVSCEDDVSSGFQINSGLNDAWWNPAINGQGLLITVYPDIKVMFVAWYTFDVERPAEDVTAMLGGPGQRWLTASGSYDGDTADLVIYVTEGGVFDSAEPPATTDQDGDGTMTLEFAGCEEGLVSYEITSLDISGEIPIERVALDNVPLCEALNAELNAE